MNNIFTIFKKELKSFFTSPMAYIFLVVFALINGYFFNIQFFLINESDLKGKVRANKSGCLDVCEKGPAVVIYPQGHWYLDVDKSNISRIFKESVIGEKSVAEHIASQEQLDGNK